MKDEKFSKIFLEEADKIIKTITENGIYLDVVEKQQDKIDGIYELIETCIGKGRKSLHVYGKGRSGTAAVAFALRAKHFGYNVSFGGDVVKERIYDDDVVILFSGSGETDETVTFARKGKKAGAKIIAITSYEESTLGELSDIIFFLPGGMEKSKGWEYLGSQLSESKLYGGGEYELFAYLFQETLLSGLGRYNDIEQGMVIKAHERDQLVK
jgi:6-phospho 3-hexuloisomerase